MDITWNVDGSVNEKSSYLRVFKLWANVHEKIVTRVSSAYDLQIRRGCFSAATAIRKNATFSIISRSCFISERIKEYLIWAALEPKCEHYCKLKTHTFYFLQLLNINIQVLCVSVSLNMKKKDAKPISHIWDNSEVEGNKIQILRQVFSDQLDKERWQRQVQAPFLYAFPEYGLIIHFRVYNP